MNNDPASGINPALNVSGEEPTNADVVGGSLVAGKRAVPWAIFRQQETNAAPPPHDQIFSRSFAAGAWTTRGIGTVGGVSSASPTFKGSLNFDQGQNGEAPSIDFAGGGRTVPWATWYEDRPGHAVRQQQHLRQPLRQHRRREPGQVDLRRAEPRNHDRRRRGSVDQHPHQPERREPVRGGRFGGGPDQAGPVDHLAGDRHRAGQRQGSDLHGPADRTGERQLRRRQARRRGRSPDTSRRSAASAGSRRGSPAPAPTTPTPARTSTRPATGSNPTSRSPVPTTASPGSSGMRPERPAWPACTPTRWCSRPRASATASRPTAAFTGSPSATRSQATLDTSGTTHFGKCVDVGDQRGAVLAEQQSGRRMPRTRRSPPER